MSAVYNLYSSVVKTFSLTPLPHKLCECIDKSTKQTERQRTLCLPPETRTKEG